MWTLLLLTMLTHAADKAVYPPQKIRAKGVERIEIIGVRGSVHIQGNRAPIYTLKVGHSKKRSDDWSLLVERRGKTLVLEVASAAYGREWNRQISRAQWPEFDINLAGPAKPVTISWREGDMTFKNWESEVESSFLKGPLTIENGGGRYRLQAVRSDVRVTGFNGELDLQGENGAVHLENTKGAVKMNWLNGRFTAINVNGKIAVEGRDLDARIKEARGEWQFKTAAGKVNLTNLKAKFKGEGESAEWWLSGGTTSELELISITGPVLLKWNAPAKVFLTSDSGDIRSPYPVRDRDGHRVAEGKKGRTGVGQVFVRTASSAIVFAH